MPCIAKDMVEQGVLTMLCLLNVTVEHSSSLILDVHVGATISDFGAYDLPNVVVLSEPQCARRADLLWQPWYLRYIADRSYIPL